LESCCHQQPPHLKFGFRRLNSGPRHAQIFGWIGTFILGIGFYSIPKLRRMDPFALWAGWTCWIHWTSGVSLRWLTGVYQWQWRVLPPVSAAFESRRVPELLFFGLWLPVAGLGEAEAGRMSVRRDHGVTGLIDHSRCQLGAALYLAYRGISPELSVQFDR
jgi:hypothetical protein